MPLIALWASNPTAIGQFTVEQIVAAAGPAISAIIPIALKNFASTYPGN